jgi:hypothetical protein
MSRRVYFKPVSPFQQIVLAGACAMVCPMFLLGALHPLRNTIGAELLFIGLTLLTGYMAVGAFINGVRYLVGGLRTTYRWRR